MTTSEQKTIAAEDKRGKLRLVASPDGAADSVTINADARLYAGLFDGQEKCAIEADAGRKYYLHLVRGEPAAPAKKIGAGAERPFRARRAVMYCWTPMQACNS